MQDYKPDTVKMSQNQTVSGQMDKLLKSDSPYMQQAATAGQQFANKRGLLNSTMGAQASQNSAIQAAMPIAQQDAANYNQFANLAASTSANTQGKYLDSVNQVTNNAMVSINEIETAEGISQSEKDKMIANTIKRRDADLAWTRNLYSNMPTWDFSWLDTPAGGMPSAPGIG